MVPHRTTATLAHVLPYAAFMALMQLDRVLGIAPEIGYPIRFVAVLLILATVSRPYIDWHAAFPIRSVLVGSAVFLIWVAPDLLFHYRHSWLFNNALTGSAVSSVPDRLRGAIWFLVLRTLTSTALVPVFEELFWRSWLMRWWIKPDFQTVALGQYAPRAFWSVAVLFAAEHGPYWEIGLAAGVMYNWWLVRCRQLGDCILAHAVTNGLLSIYVLSAGQWRYWL